MAYTWNDCIESHASRYPILCICNAKSNVYNYEIIIKQSYKCSNLQTYNDSSLRIIKPQKINILNLYALK